MTPKHDLLFDTNLQVSLEDYTINEDAENGMNVIVSVNLKQYKPYATKTVEVKKTAEGKKATAKKARKITKEIPKIFKIVKSGQTLWEICKGKLGDTSKLLEIAKLNDITNPNVLILEKVIKFVK
jgi:nucleoid-associated protein YgaU